MRSHGNPTSARFDNATAWWWIYCRGSASIVDTAVVDLSHLSTMPIPLSHTAPTLLIRRTAFERVQLTRQIIDEALGLTDEEFLLEGGLIAIGPLVGESALTDLIEAMERAGLVYFEDFFELSGNWPEWLGLFAMTS